MLKRVALVVFTLIQLGQGGLPASSVDAQEVRDSTKRLAPTWRHSARYGGGPSVGARFAREILSEPPQLKPIVRLGQSGMARTIPISAS